MKRFIVLALLVASISQPIIKAGSIATNGIAPYSQVPLDINKGGEVAFNFVTKVALVFSYDYVVTNGSNVIIGRGNESGKSLPRNTSVTISYYVRPYTFSVGSNRLTLTFKTSLDQNVRTHNCYFYGYEPGMNVNLNNATATANAFYNEVEFVYHGYEVGTVAYKRTTFRTSNLNGTLYFPTDFAFLFNELYFYVTGSYGPAFYKEALLFFKDYTLFPHLSRVRGEAVLELELSKIGNDISFAPLRTLYVDPLTLHVRNEYRAGLVPAQKLYFPREAYGRTDLAMCRLEIKEFGFHKFNLVYDFHLEIGMPFLGQGGFHEVIIIRS